jgi:hypothetical protein
MFLITLCAVEGEVASPPAYGGSGREHQRGGVVDTSMSSERNGIRHPSEWCAPEGGRHRRRRSASSAPPPAALPCHRHRSLRDGRGRRSPLRCRAVVAVVRVEHRGRICDDFLLRFDTWDSLALPLPRRKLLLQRSGTPPPPSQAAASRRRR